MGAWGPEAFSNDDALDWIAELVSAKNFTLLENTLAAVTTAGADYLEAPMCSQALAAAEVIAALCGKPSNNLPKEVVAWQQGKPQPPTNLLHITKQAIARISENSELRELWEDSGNYQVWRDSVADLQKRLN